MNTSLATSVTAARFLHRMGMRAEAEAAFRGILAVHPEQATVWNDLGNVLADLRRYDDAFAAYRHAIALAPDFADAHSDFGNALMLTFAFDAAEASLRQAIRLNPVHALAHANLGDALMAQGRRDEALDSYRRAVALAPDSAPIHLHYANALFLCGFVRDGFTESEWRWRTQAVRLDPVRCPLYGWRGEPLDGRTIRLYAEQGFGDGIQFARYATPVAERGGRVVLLVREGLARLLASVSGVAAVETFPETARLVPGRDCDVSLMTLPHILGTDLDTIPAAVPYVQADAAATARWRHRLAERPGLKVGLVWAGDPRPESFECNLIDSRRSMTLAELAPLAAVDGVSFVSLQKGAAASQADSVGLDLIDAMDEMRDFADTAALVAALDLVIAVDTSVAHLAGALARPVWILSRYDGCWRWMVGRDDSPWYPTARLFRQSVRGDWSGAVTGLVQALRQWVGEQKPDFAGMP